MHFETIVACSGYRVGEATHGLNVGLEDLGNAKCMNIVLFGGMVKALHMDDIDWEAVIAETVPPKFKELNLQAYRAGYAAV